MDNIFIDRLWRPRKQEAVYLTEIADGLTARRVILHGIDFYNGNAPTRPLDDERRMRHPAIEIWRH